MEKNYI